MKQTKNELEGLDNWTCFMEKILFAINFLLWITTFCDLEILRSMHCSKPE